MQWVFSKSHAVFLKELRICFVSKFSKSTFEFDKYKTWTDLSVDYFE